LLSCAGVDTKFEKMSDSDDDKPIIALIEKRKQQQKALRDSEVRPAKKARSSESNLKVDIVVKEDKPTKSRSSSSGQTTARKSIAFYEETSKGMLVQRLLVRWWYAIEWPKKHEIGQPPHGYESLEGFPGVFISTKSDSLGTILDLRNKTNCPSLRNLSNWPSSELRSTCITAYEAQMAILKAQEGDECALYRTLKAELKEVRRVDCDKADKEARKYDFSR
jgi:hypothetical protein